MRLRAPLPDDTAAVLELIVARDVADIGRPDYTLEDVQADWAAPGFDLAQDAWVAEDGDGLLGYALLEERGVAMVSVPPESEGRGVGRALREAAEARAAARGEATVRQYVAAANEAALAHLHEAGYRVVSRSYRMRMDLADAPDAPRDLPVRTFRRGDDDAPVHELAERAMADVPGNLPSSLESFRASTIEKTGWDPSLWLLHEDADGLDAAALCERWGDSVGFVAWLVVAARSRGRGLGRALLLHAFAKLRARGLTVAELHVQAQNASATRLYESVGMLSVWTAERWEKPLAPAT